MDEAKMGEIARQKLPQGASLIAVRDDGYLVTVLAHWKTRMEYVTWKMLEDGSTGLFSGHYFKAFDDAVKDYQTR